MDIMYAHMKSTENKLAMSSVHRRRHACFCHVFPAGHRTLQFVWLLSAFLLVAFNYCVNDTVAFNLENRLPIVKYGSPDTYFGYSVAGHTVEDDEDGSTQKWILVGAPLGQNSQPGTNRSGALFKCPITQNFNDCSQVITDGRRFGAPLGQNSQPGTNRSGALFKCPITQNFNDCSQVITDGRRFGAPLGQNSQPGTNRSGALFKCPITQNFNDCSQVITDGRRYSDDDELEPPLNDLEIKNGQWMGVTVRSQKNSGKVLVCAHRYIAKTGESQHGQGLCYVLTNDLKFDEAYEPCKGRPVGREHEEYGYCQVGTSGAMLEDDTIVLGSPGPYTWRGTLFVISVGGEYLRRDKHHYYGPHMDLTSPVDKYSYLGMAVTGGRYYGNYMSYAAGAPRSNDTGQVVIFSKSHSPTIDVVMTVAQIIDGEQFGSSFGYEIITADVNGDNADDLLIAAPFFYSKTEGGAVYIYQNVNYSLPNNYTAKLTGKLESRFGLAMTNIGDINKDGCDDVAIGAPYEENGVVYIYLGSKNGLKLSQVISPSVLGLITEPIKTFGSSLSGSIDFDDNSYPDLVIGSYQSANVVTLLSRPIINITTEVRGELKNVDPSKQGCSSNSYTNLTCFTIEACCTISPYKSSRESQTLELLYTIEAETFNSKKKFSRVFFGPDFNKRSNILKRRLLVKTNNRMNCQRETIYVKENTRDIQSAINFRLNYSIVEPQLPRSALSAPLNPILDQTQADREFQVTFQKDCGTDDFCQSQLEVFPELQLEKDDDGYNLILGKSKELLLNVSVVNENESAYEAQLFIEHQPTVTFIQANVSKNHGHVICNKFNGTIVACTLGNPLKRKARAEVVIRFDPIALDDAATQLVFKVFANTTSKQQIPREPNILLVNVVKQTRLLINRWAYPEQVFYGGEVRGESAMKYIEDVGTPVQHSYQIQNYGPARVPYLKVQIRWPHQVANDKEKGKWLLYLAEQITIEGPEGKCSEVDINPLKLEKKPKEEGLLINEPAEYVDYRSFMKNRSQSLIAESSEKRPTSTKHSSSSVLNRVRRDHAVILKAEPLIGTDGKSRETVNMDCGKKTAKCVTINCEIYNMPSETDAFITVRARLWNSTLVADYPRVDQVTIVSSIQISIPDVYNIHQLNGDVQESVTTHAYPDLKIRPGDGSIPIWIIIVSIIGGLLLLALFTYCLYRLGFFKRRRPDPTLSGNLEKNSESKSLLK